MTALLAEVGPPIAALLIGFGWSFGHRAGVQRERERSSKRAVQMMETRNLIRERSRWIRTADDHDARRENTERYAQEDRDDDRERADDERDRWQYQGGTTADDFE